MVKIGEIPVEKERVDLATLPEKNILKAVREEVREAAIGKTGGLVIWYATKDGKEFPQKYSAVSGRRLAEALKNLGYESTEPLFKSWHLYNLEPMRVGYPRYIPVKKA